MAKTLASYVRFIPDADQETMVAVLSPKRQNIHRGMLCFIPIEELIDRLRRYYAYDSSPYAPNPIGPSPYGNPFGGMGIGSLQQSYQPGYQPYGQAVNKQPHSPPPSATDIHFAYSALLIAMAMQKKDEELREGTVEDEAGNAQAPAEVA